MVINEHIVYFSAPFDLPVVPGCKTTLKNSVAVESNLIAWDWSKYWWDVENIKENTWIL